MKFNDLSITFHTLRFKECADFYVKYLGATITFDHEWYVTVKFQSDVNPYINLSFMHPDYSSIAQTNDSHQGFTTLNFMVPDVDAAYNEAKSTGIEIVREMEHKPWGDRSFVISDPLGNIIYIWQVAEMSEEYKNSMKE